MLIRRNTSMRADINVTNLIDITFVLLIAFMITAPLMTQAVQVNTPRVAAESVQIEKNIAITIDRGKTIYVAENEMSKEDMLVYLKEKLSPRELPILLNADEELSYGFVLEIIASIRELGYTRIGFLTKPPSAEE